MPEWLSKRTIHYLHQRTIIDFNGHELIAPEPEPFIMMTRLASGEIDEIELAEWVRVNLSPPLD